MKKIIIIGSGAMGAAFAVPCAENKNNVTIVGTHLEDNLIKNIIANDNLHPGLKTKIPNNRLHRFPVDAIHHANTTPPM